MKRVFLSKSFFFFLKNFCDIQLVQEAAASKMAPNPQYSHPPGIPTCPIRIGCVNNRIHGRNTCLVGYQRHCSKSRALAPLKFLPPFCLWEISQDFLTARLQQVTSENTCGSINEGSAPRFLVVPRPEDPGDGNRQAFLLLL